MEREKGKGGRVQWTGLSLGKNCSASVIVDDQCSVVSHLLRHSGLHADV